jgi:1-acyl-sn-glycerol-3-phosphate acyltransferase
MAAILRLLPLLLVLVPATLLLAPIQMAAMFLSKPLARAIPVFWHRLALRLVGVRVHVQGQIPSKRPLLIVSNHVSWADILVLGSVMQLCFIAKSDMMAWPGINWLAWMQRTVFVKREDKRGSKAQAGTIAARLLEGDAMVLFAEGTTGDGIRLRPFKSALFGAVHHALETANISHVTVQPVALAYTRLNGLPLGRYHQSRAAWPGDIPLGPHLLAFISGGAYDVEVVFGEAGDFALDTPRKKIADITRGRVRAAFASAIRMRPLAPEKADA